MYVTRETTATTPAPLAALSRVGRFLGRESCMYICTVHIHTGRPSHCTYEPFSTAMSRKRGGCNRHGHIHIYIQSMCKFPPLQKCNNVKHSTAGLYRGMYVYEYVPNHLKHCFTGPCLLFHIYRWCSGDCGFLLSGQLDVRLGYLLDYLIYMVLWTAILLSVDYCRVREASDVFLFFSIRHRHRLFLSS